MRPTFLGKIFLRWCDTCHTPVLAPQCACGAPTREVFVTAAWRCTPGIPGRFVRINRIYEDHFGAPLHPGGPYCTPRQGTGRRQDGRGHCRRRNRRNSSGIFPISSGGNRSPADRDASSHQRNILSSSPMMRVPFIRDQGMSVLAPGLFSIDDSVRAGTRSVILGKDGFCIGAGRARVSAEEARSMKKGAIVKTRKISGR